MASRAGGHIGSKDVVRVPVEVVARWVVPHGGSRIAVTSGDMDVAEIDSCVEHDGDEGVPQHVADNWSAAVKPERPAQPGVASTQMDPSRTAC
jgi:hypothetical protein